MFYSSHRCVERSLPRSLEPGTHSFPVCRLICIQVAPSTLTVGPTDTAVWRVSWVMNVEAGFICIGEFTVQPFISANGGFFVPLVSVRSFILEQGSTIFTDDYLGLTSASLTPQELTVVSNFSFHVANTRELTSRILANNQ